MRLRTQPVLQRTGEDAGTHLRCGFRHIRRDAYDLKLRSDRRSRPSNPFTPVRKEVHKFEAAATKHTEDFLLLIGKAALQQYRRFTRTVSSKKPTRYSDAAVLTAVTDVRQEIGTRART